MKIHSALVFGLALAQGVSAAQRGGGLRTKDLQLIQRDLESRDWADDLWNEIKNAATCAGAQGVLGLLKGLSVFGKGFFNDVLTEVCKLSGSEDDDVCEGAVRLEGPLVYQAVKQIKLGSDAAEQFCITFIGLCDFPDVKPLAIPFSSPKPTTGRPPPSGQKPLKVVQYSDIHTDLMYTTGANTECDKPICCRPYTPEDAPGNTAHPAGPNGDHRCDTPVSLEKSMYAAIKQLVPDAAFVLFTGDIVDHVIWNTTQEYNTQQINGAYEAMSATLGTVYGTIGNHEASPVNGFQPNSLGHSTQWVYDLVSTQWRQWIGDDGAADTQNIGAYSVKHAGSNLRVISLNTNLYYRQNYWLYQKTMIQDPNNQIAWLAKELEAAEKAGENVYIIGHMPPGDSDSFHEGSHYLDQVFNRYSSTIAAMFFGHTHKDHFEISYSDYAARSASNALLTAYICPSLTPTSGMPSFRVYDVDPVTFGILDSTTYIADMTNAAFQTTGPVWTKLYSAKEVYGPTVNPPVTDASAELTASFWHKVTEVFETNDAVYNEFLARKSRGWKAETCAGACKAGEICQLRAARAENNCFKPTAGVHFTKRTENKMEHRDECGISVIRASLNSVTTKKEVLDTMHFRYLEASEKAKRA